MDTDLDQATAIRYGDVFTVQGDLAGKPVAPGDAAALQAAEARVLGRTPRSGPGAVMGSAATVNYHAEDGITVGEALEAAALSVGEKPVDQADAAAIQAAEVRAIQSNRIPPGGIAAMAQSAANQNARTMGDENKTTVGDILSVHYN
ncbi:Late embryogenesis abundant protein 32 [Linum grandiflorum]